jgi:hypothetical protein
VLKSSKTIKILSLFTATANKGKRTVTCHLCKYDVIDKKIDKKLDLELALSVMLNHIEIGAKH